MADQDASPMVLCREIPEGSLGSIIMANDYFLNRWPRPQSRVRLEHHHCVSVTMTIRSGLHKRGPGAGLAVVAAVSDRGDDAGFVE